MSVPSFETKVSMTKKPFSFKRRLKSFTYAFSGLKTLFREEHNAWLHATAAILVIVAGLLFRISETEWMAVFLCIGLVIGAEAFNSAIERLSDMVQPERDERIKTIKDLSAGAVLACAVAAAAVGIIVFVPKVISLF